jgi:hypothetical protein
MKTNLKAKALKNQKKTVTEKRVSVKAVEFDWIFNTKHGNKFMETLAITKNLNLFKIPVIEDVILFQWHYFRIAIISLLFVPFILYFILFGIYATWSYTWMRDPDASYRWTDFTKAL